MSAVADVLNGAADLIERDGWVQAGFRTSGGRCADKAILDSANTLGEKAIPALRAAAEVVGGSIMVWNDEFGRTKAEVVAALRAAAERVA